MEKKFKICPHGMMYQKCPLCKDDIEERRIDKLIENEDLVGKEII